MISRRSSLLFAAAAAASLLLACTPTNTGLENIKPLELRGAYDLARVMIPRRVSEGGPIEFVKDHVYVLSSEKDQVHILDLTLDNKRDHVRAPNPIEPLAIPVLRHPTRLAVDTTWQMEDVGPAGNPRLDFYEFGGPFVYAYNPASPDISIIDASEDRVRETHRLKTTAAVTAVSARGRFEGQSTLYFATRDDAGAKLFAVELSADATDFSGVRQPAVPLLELPGETITTLLTMPPSTSISTDESVVVATRGAGNAGSTFLYDRTAGTRMPLNFPAPVRDLETHSYTNQLPAGQLIFGILDETACDGGDTCRGILAVNRNDGQIALDDHSLPMLPIVNGDALPVALTLVSFGTIGRTDVFIKETLPLMGIVSYSTRELTVFDAAFRRSIDGDISVPSFGDPDIPDTGTAPETDVIQQLAPDGTVVGTSTAGGGPLGMSALQLVAAEGVVRSETMAVAYLGRVPGLDRLPLDPAAPVPTTFTFDPAFTQTCPDLAPGTPDPDPERCVRVRPGDQVFFGGACTESVEILTVAGGTLTTAAPPAGCTSASSWTVRAAGARPFVVSGTYTGFMGRAAPGAFSWYGPRYYRPGGFTLADITRPALTFSLSDNVANLQRDSRFVVRINGGFFPLYFGFDSGTGGQMQFDRNPFPGAMVFRCSDGEPDLTEEEPPKMEERTKPCENAAVRRLYVAFPALPDLTNENVGWIAEYDAATMYENSVSVADEFFP